MEVKIKSLKFIKKEAVSKVKFELEHLSICKFIFLKPLQPPPSGRLKVPLG